MAGIPYFQGLSFPLFGISRKSTAKTDLPPRYYGIQYIHSGSLYLSVDEGPAHTVKGPCVFLTSPEVRFSYGSPPHTTREQYHVCFDGPRVKDFLKKGLFIPARQREIPYIRLTSPASFLSDMLDLIRLLQNEKCHDLAVAKLEYLLLIIQNQEIENTFGGFHRPQLENLVQRILTAPEDDWDFHLEANRMNITLKHFRRLFQSFCGMPPNRFVLRQRILKAGRLLAMEREPIKSIAFECGFRNEFYFSRLFKKHMKVSPQTYRSRQSLRADYAADARRDP